ncbi:hypothetical protein NP511_12195 [Natrinema thermotolerans]|uniref:Uncharacterized protein n=1 Tax=Natrinema thermotolerans TaxID=121872 RepID=A0AAF0P7Y3_9EURY|nr:hypothetical protein [Natrinema thermotolerans]QCC59185.1 hypothetical protein DVR14_11325 [Natrinema thermotolerans]WMT06145.1 hypothetical protein NP511_12195 [Natrinema thermotolerans]
MHFDQRTQRALRDAGLETDDLRAASEAVVEAVADDAAALEAFFDDHDTVYSDMDMAHSSSAYPEHAVDYADITTHGDEMRGWLRFETWGVYVEGGRLLDEDVVELSLGPTINDRVRFAADRDRLR